MNPFAKVKDSQATPQIHEILQARILEWVAFPFSKDLPNPGIKPRSLALQVDSLPVAPQGKAIVIKPQSIFKKGANFKHSDC